MLIIILIFQLCVIIMFGIKEARAEERYEELSTKIDALLTSGISAQGYLRIAKERGEANYKLLDEALEHLAVIRKKKDKTESDKQED